MPLLTYSYPPFVANTVIQSAKVNAKYTDIQTLLNVTGLDDVNLQDAGITRATKLKPGTANYVVINDNTGKMSEEAALSTSRGGTGLALSLSPSDSGKSFAVLPDGSGFQLIAPVGAAGSLIYTFNRFI